MIRNIVFVVFSISLAWLASAATPPDLLNYQGVLRDASDAPLDGDHDMVFSFFKSETIDVSILVDRHTLLGGNAVSVSGGLFNVQLGGGDVSDGTAPGTYTSLAEVFRDYSTVYLEIEVEGEVLSPRVRLVSAGYALNADHLDGRDSDYFLNTSASAQTKTGDLTVNELTLTGELIAFAGGGQIVGGEDSVRINGMHNDDDLLLFGGNDALDGSVRIRGQGDVYFHSYGGNFAFTSTDSPVDTALLDRQGNFDIAGRLQVGSMTAAEVAWNRFGSTGSYVSGDITQKNDVQITGDLEVDDVVYVDRSIVVADDTPTTNQEFSSFGEADDKVSSDIINRGDVYVNGFLEVGRLIYADGLYTQSQGYVDLVADSYIYTLIDGDNDSATDEYRWYHNSWDQLAEIQEDGDLRIAGTLSESVTFDIAESFVAGEPLEPGDLVAVHPDRPDTVRRTAGADDRAVIGVVSTKPGILLGDAPFEPAALKEVWSESVHERFLEARDRLREEVVARHPDLKARQEISSKDDEAEKNRRRLADDIDGLALELFFEENFVPVALAGRVPVKVDAEYGPILPGDPLAPSPKAGVAMKADSPGPVIGVALERVDNGSGTILAFISRSFYTPAEEIASLRQQQDVPASMAEERTFDKASVAQTSSGNSQSLSGVDEVDISEESSSPTYIDVAELFPLSEPAEPGDLLIADREAPGSYMLSRVPSDPAVIGVVAASPSVILGQGIERCADSDPELEPGNDRDRPPCTQAPVAMTGTVLAKVDAGYGSVRVGDLLTTSPTPGHAMRADDPQPGTVIGKALEPLETGMGKIKILVMQR